MANVNTRSGFTILEVLIVVGMLALISAIIMPSSWNNSIRKKIDNEAQRISDIIQLAKAKAAANDYANYACPFFDGYRASFRGSDYRLELCCRNTAASAVCSTSFLINQYQVDPDVTLTAAGMPLSGGYRRVIYQPLILGTNLTSTGTIRLTNATIGKCILMTIDPIGTVNVGAVQSTPC